MLVYFRIAMPIYWQTNKKKKCTFRNISASNFVINRILVKEKQLLLAWEMESMFGKLCDSNWKCNRLRRTIFDIQCFYDKFTIIYSL